MNRKISLLIIGIIIILLCTNFQKKIFSNDKEEEILLKQVSFREIVEYEKLINPNVQFIDMQGGLSNDVYPLSDKYKVSIRPIIAKREPIGYLPLSAQYFYSKNDSILRMIIYDWEKGSFSNLYNRFDIFKEESKKFETYCQEYQRILKVATNKLGTPKSFDKTPQKVKSNDDRGDYFVQNSKWDTDDYHAELRMIFEKMTYRIGLRLYWKK